MVQDLKKRFYEESKELIPIFGLTEELLSKVAQEIDVQDTIFISPKDFVTYYLEQKDQELLDKLNQIDASKFKIRERIKQALVLKFSLNPKEVTKEIAKFLTSPRNVELGFKSLARTCNNIWIWAGDQSTDFNYYSKRTLLAGVYSTSLAYYLKKDERTVKDIESFIENRIADVLKIGGLKNKIKGLVGIK